MNTQQTAQVLALLSAAYPSASIPEATAMLWADEMANRDPEVCMTAARRIAREDTRFPSIARFLEMVRACTPSEIVKALPELTMSDEDRAANIAKARQMIAKATKSANHL